MVMALFYVGLCRELPMLGSLEIRLFREVFKKKREVMAVGKIEIPTLMLESGQVTEKWWVTCIQDTLFALLTVTEQVVSPCIH